MIPFWKQKTRTYASWFKEFGAANNIYNLDYPYMAGPEKIEQVLMDQMTSILKRYPANVKFDVIGHSFGAFTSLYSVARSSYVQTHASVY